LAESEALDFDEPIGGAKACWSSEYCSAG